MHRLFFYPSAALKPNPKATRDSNVLRKATLAKMLNSISSRPIRIDECSLEDKIILCAYIRACGDDSLETLLPIGQDQFSIRFTPRRECSYHLLRRLLQHHTISLISDVGLPAMDADIRLAQLETAHFMPNFIGPQNERLSLKAISEVLEEDLLAQHLGIEDTVKGLWMELAIQESIEYLEALLSERGFPFKSGEKIEAIFRQILSRYSTSQSFYFIYSAARNASDFFQAKGVSRQHAANTVTWKIQNLFDRAISESWSVPKYRRSYDTCPPSALNNVLYDKVLGLSSSGIDCVPGSPPPESKESHDE